MKYARDVIGRGWLRRNESEKEPRHAHVLK